MRFVYVLLLITSLTFSNVVYLSGGISAEIDYGQVTYTSSGNINFYKYFIKGRQNATSIRISNLLNGSNKITLVLDYNGTIKDVKSTKSLNVVIGDERVVVHFQLGIGEKLTLILVGTNRIERIGSYSGFLPPERFIKTNEDQSNNTTINQSNEQNISGTDREVENKTNIVEKNVSVPEPLIINYEEEKHIDVVSIILFIVVFGLALIISKYILGILKDKEPPKKEEPKPYSVEDDVYLERFFEE